MACIPNVWKNNKVAGTHTTERWLSPRQSRPGNWSKGVENDANTP